MCVSGTVFVMLIPPLSFFLKTMLGGSLLIRIPNPSSSASITFLSVRGLLTSKTMKIRWHVFATAMTWRPRPLPSLAPWIIPGRSSIWIAAPLYWTCPGTVVNVVNSYAATAKDQYLLDSSAFGIPNPLSAGRSVCSWACFSQQTETLWIRRWRLQSWRHRSQLKCIRIMRDFSTTSFDQTHSLLPLQSMRELITLCAALQVSLSVAPNDTMLPCSSASLKRTGEISWICLTGKGQVCQLTGHFGLDIFNLGKRRYIISFNLPLQIHATLTQHTLSAVVAIFIFLE